MSLSVVGTLLATAGSATAQVGGNVNLDAFRPAVDSRGYITVNASQILGHKELSFGLVTDWGYKVLKFEDGDNSYEVKHIITPTLIAAFGLKVGPLEIEPAVSLPFHVMQGDEDPDDEGEAGNPNDDQDFGFDGQGLGDIGLHAKVRILSTSRKPGIGLAVIGSLYLPTASDNDRWYGEDKVTPQLLGVVDKEFGAERELRMAVQGGIRIRTGDHGFVDTTTTGAGGDQDPPLMSPATNVEIEAKSTIPLGAAIAYGVVPQKFDLIAEAFTEIPTGGDNFFPGEVIGGAKLYLAQNSFLSFGGGVGFMPDEGGNPDIRGFLAIVFEPNIGDRDGDGLKDDVDQCPDDPEDKDDFEDEDGCPDPDNDRDGILDVDDDCPNDPEDKDNFEDEDGCPEGNKFDRDGDGILDDVDQCPDDPEDKDGFEDTDGCPDPDNDQDGILDVDDLCPNDPEDKDGFEDADGCPEPDNDNDRILDVDDSCPRRDGETAKETAETYHGVDDTDGCPDRGRVIVTDTKIEILDKIFFEFNSDVIKSESFPILDAIVATMNGNPDISLVEIQGHTDNRGSDAYNLDLSDRRAASVRRYLTEKGVAADRLQSQGYGETQPLVNKNNEEAWSKNRRVEFLILKRAGE
ncbi:MAG TPA: OmpA family protein [Kofleriaceae bacterium]|nr:OmpA family protein [Kofleriaceae bacterium]